MRTQMQACLAGRGGEVSARARAAELGRTYLGLDSTGRRNFLTVLARDFDVDRAVVDKAVDAFHRAVDPASRGDAERALRAALEPGRMRLLTQFNGLPEGIKFLVDMRAQLLEWARDDSLMSALEADMKTLLRNWFDVGFLELRRITWDSPASLLEKLIAYEAVHEIRGWQDLKDRLDSDRRCFAFFHPRMPDEPLIFVEVALVTGMSDNVQTLLDEAAPVQDPQTADTAIFYSISNAQKGLAGISFGNFLIKRVVDDLTAEFPKLKHFATLSPIPGFRRWLDGELAKGEGVVTNGESARIADLFADPDVLPPESGATLAAVLDRPDWQRDEATVKVVKPILMRLCATYLIDAKAGKRARDPVAHFHLSNGARMERLNWLGDTSDKGLRQSAGLMINYRYKLGDIEANHESYTGDGKINVSSYVKAHQKSTG
ncbi:malonyl-CoA decarboxylase [Skermanella stibiiresistens SB22]|uniref:Malonyl-CoA decarboxylase n=1 Tax=Skermanella stibiiresistens SB22 TaxID=1385369 RepID=W9HBK8_9PROT|nr:malonyl-CoA decarboxylase [Skermanella stibiiresistens SB22]